MRQTASFVPISEVLTHMQFGVDEQAHIFDFGFKNVSFGDAEHTLIKNDAALLHILDCFDEEYLDVQEDVLVMRYWEVVDIDDFIDLEH